MHLKGAPAGVEPAEHPPPSTEERQKVQVRPRRPNIDTLFPTNQSRQVSRTGPELGVFRF